MAEFNLQDLNEIYSQGEIMDYLVNKGIINEKKFVKQLKYEVALDQLQKEFYRLQSYIIENKLKVLVILEGRDAAGKGGTIRRMVNTLNPKKYDVVALPKPTELERQQWYFQRYIKELPTEGKFTFFDRSWYNRAVVEPVFGFCTHNQYLNFMDSVGDLEELLIKDGIIFFKLFLSISKEEQNERLEARRENPLKRYKIGGLDEQAQEKWDEYSDYIQKMFEQTSYDYSPWVEIKTDSKKKARLETMRYILANFPGYSPNSEIEIDNKIIRVHS